MRWLCRGAAASTCVQGAGPRGICPGTHTHANTTIVNQCVCARGRRGRVRAGIQAPGRAPSLRRVLRELEPSELEEALQVRVRADDGRILLVQKIVTAALIAVSGGGGVVLDNEGAALPEASPAPREEADDVAVGQVAENPLRPHQVVRVGRRRELAQR